MPKVEKGRLDGVRNMQRFSASDLHEIANEYDAKFDDPSNQDDPKWLRRRADRMRKLALGKQKSFEHKLNN